MDATLTHRTYPTNTGGTFTVVHGVVHYEGWSWRVATTITIWADGYWHIGSEADNQRYRERHFNASKVGGGKLTAMATIPETRVLMRIVEDALAAGEVTPAPTITDWCSHLVPTVPQVHIAAHAPQPFSTVKDGVVTHKETKTMTNQCEIITKRGAGPRCPNMAVEGSTICKTHVFLLAKLGELPRVGQEVVGAVKEAVSALVPASETPAAVMAQRFTPDAAAVELAPPVTQTPAPSTEPMPKTRKPRKDKSTTRVAKKAVSPKAR